jgi:hypothetical protein
VKIFAAMFVFIMAMSFLFMSILWQFFVGPKCFETDWKKPFWTQLNGRQSQRGVPANTLSNSADGTGKAAAPNNKKA